MLRRHHLPAPSPPQSACLASSSPPDLARLRDIPDLPPILPQTLAERRAPLLRYPYCMRQHDAGGRSTQPSEPSVAVPFFHRCHNGKEQSSRSSVSPCKVAPTDLLPVSGELELEETGAGDVLKLTYDDSYQRCSFSSAAKSERDSHTQRHRHLSCVDGSCSSHTLRCRPAATRVRPFPFPPPPQACWGGGTPSRSAGWVAGR